MVITYGDKIGGRKLSVIDCYAESEDRHLADITFMLPIEGQRENQLQRMRRILKEAQLCRRVFMEESFNTYLHLVREMRFYAATPIR